jgi:hypothetical protein
MALHDPRRSPAGGLVRYKSLLPIPLAESGVYLSVQSEIFQVHLLYAIRTAGVK